MYNSITDAQKIHFQLDIELFECAKSSEKSLRVIILKGDRSIGRFVTPPAARRPRRRRSPSSLSKPATACIPVRSEPTWRPPLVRARRPPPKLPLLWFWRRPPPQPALLWPRPPPLRPPRRRRPTNAGVSTTRRWSSAAAMSKRPRRTRAVASTASMRYETKKCRI